MAWLFRDPLLKKDAIEREIKSMESEFEANFHHDGTRRYQLMSELADKDSLLHKFSWGNLKSLQGAEPDKLYGDL
jgi:nardilysin